MCGDRDLPTKPNFKCVYPFVDDEMTLKNINAKKHYVNNNVNIFRSKAGSKSTACFLKCSLGVNRYMVQKCKSDLGLE